ncbi:hypothetical protein CLAIMM_06262 [Cladophialophora immunda]|nr:hypothetical protein CLAIMM_06262 [Cladophialophora immunda]
MPSDIADRQQDLENISEKEAASTIHAEEFKLTEKEKLDAIDDIDPENRHAAKADDSDGKTEWHWRTIFATIGLAGLYVGSQLPSQMVGGALGYVSADIHTSFASWLITANTLAYAAVCPFVGYVTDLVGRRWIVLAGGVSIVVGSIVIATTHTFGQAVAGMAIAGAGGGICELSALAGIAEIAPIRRRGVYLGACTFTIAPFAPYLIYCELLSTKASWRWCVWIITIWTGLFWVLAAAFYFPLRPFRTRGVKTAAILKRMDWIGGALSIVGVTLVLVAFQDGGYRYPWQSVHVLAPLIIGFAAVAVFVYWEGWLAPHPMIPRGIFGHDRAVGLALIVATAGGISLYSVFAFFPLLLQTLYPQESALKRGVRGLGYGFSIFLSATFTNSLLSYTKGHVKEPLLVALVIMAAFTGSLAHCNPTNPDYATVMATFAGIGIGGIITPAATVAMVCCPDAVISTVTGLSLCVRTFGGALGTTIYSAIFQNKIAHYLPQYVAQYVSEAGLPAASVSQFVTVYLTSPADISKVPGVNQTILAQAALGQSWAYAKSLEYVWYASVGFSAAAFGFCLFIPNIKRHMTNRISVVFH